MTHSIIPYQSDYKDDLIDLIANFRVSLRALKNRETVKNLHAATEELDFYLGKQYPIFLAYEANIGVVGYIVVKIEEEVVWAESLFVLESSRRKGIGADLYRKAEKIAQTFQQDTIYNWIHPNNTKIINFLKKRGYDVLNLVEIRKKRQNEVIHLKITIGENSFNY